MSALEKIDPGERAASVGEACSHDDALRQRVEILLKAHEDPASFMKSPIAGSAAAMIATIDDPIRERPGTVIGSYKLRSRSVRAALASSSWLSRASRCAARWH
jgi:hypothetical protein